MERFQSFQVHGQTLRGIVHWPEEGSAQSRNSQLPAIVMCHGFCGTKVGLHRIFVKAARFFAQAGYAVLRFDFSGCGDSDGEYERTTLTKQVHEACAAVKTIASTPGIDPYRITLLGLSLGGAVTALAAPRLPQLERTILWAPVARPWQDITGILGEELTAEILKQGIGDFEGYAISKPFIESLREYEPLKASKKFPKPSLILHGTNDNEISCANTLLYRENRNAAGLQHLTEIDFIQDADHTFTSLAWENAVFTRTLQWLSGNRREELALFG
ncbi:alpha/beta hydrolase family protein [Heliophilum fasciatum]|uniref:Serine aminopeptidase S33 domain-containing protein n=1 Tax=Heliophilum fasciatum TaxID=35700 RepID=A0A4R2RPK9_9FIRM|nr:alpha/beta fold hydrolase [Heliophilum fasciatum]MCW2277707.1 alpha-beta hydrolase superfamily lysophospholipase [Heliophilum fasciatum]TCP65054.1 hypothetical protein EDD73_107127 [Heliophilum fasciatum]